MSISHLSAYLHVVTCPECSKRLSEFIGRLIETRVEEAVDFVKKHQKEPKQLELPFDEKIQ